MRLSMDLLQSTVKTYLNSVYTGVSSLTLTKDEISDLVNKIATSLTIVGNYNDDLPELDGIDLATGETVEEYFLDLIMPIDYDPNGANTLAPHDPTGRPASYSYALEPKNFPLTIRTVQQKQYFNTIGELADYISRKLAILGNSVNMWRYQQKLALLGKFAKAAIDKHDNAATYAVSTAYAVGAAVKNSDGVVAIVQKAIANTNTKTFAQAVAEGLINPVALVETVSDVVDTTTGEAFIKTVKADVEDSGFAGSKHNLNGAVQGVAPVTLYMRRGVKPVIDVDTMAGAFNQDKLAFPVNTKIVRDFGDMEGGKVLALMIDPRGCKLMTDQVTSDSQLNGEGHFYTIYQYRKETPYYSPNTFIKVYRTA